MIKPVWVKGRPKNCRGAGKTEYIIVVFFIAVSTITVTNLLGDRIRSVFSRSADSLAGKQNAKQTPGQGGAPGSDSGVSSAEPKTSGPAGNTNGAQGQESEKGKLPFATGLGSDVDKAAAKSPKLSKTMGDLSEKGWKFKYGPAGQGTYADSTSKSIVVDSKKKGDTSGTLTSLAHESGHARYNKDAGYVAREGQTRDSYVKKQVAASLRDEGEATLTNIEVRDDLKNHGGRSIAVAGSHTAEYERIAKEHATDRNQARTEIGDIFAHHENPSGNQNVGKNYEQYYSESWGRYYDAQPSRKKP